MRQFRCTAIGRLFIRAILSPCLSFSVSVLALSVTCGDTSPKGGNNFDRRQWRKQEEIVGAAASRMQARAKQTLGAATRVRSTSGVTVKPTLDEQSFFILKTAVPCYRGQQLRNNILVKLLLISVAGHYFLRYIRLSAGSKKWPGLPKPLLQGEVARRRRDGEVIP